MSTRLRGSRAALMGFGKTEMNAINVDTRVLARLHPQRNGRGLNIYNPYFRETNANAIYALFHNSDPKKLIQGLRSLGLPGAVVAGSFESDPTVPTLLDELHPVSEEVGVVGMVAFENEKLWGAYQGGFGLRDAIERICPDFRQRKLVIIGAGTVVHALLKVLQTDSTESPRIRIFNRTVERAENLAAKFAAVESVLPLAELAASAEGEILINATSIGSPWNVGDSYHFSEALLSRFSYVVDVTFVPLETQLTTDAARLGLNVSPGHQMFLHQAKFVLRETLGLSMNESVFERLMLADFSTNWS
ncbi:shikimate dehydrogenase family protein [Actinoallomurus sp. CA-150999]|uniref:shikimate dehydrogenase family protein n=1 Tax=Actinoallomurus sp. CA-150999 TaxID=3239887 RepID=UPI003D94BBE1